MARTFVDALEYIRGGLSQPERIARQLVPWDIGYSDTMLWASTALILFVVVGVGGNLVGRMLGWSLAWLTWAGQSRR